MAIIPQITPRVRQQAAPRPVFQSSRAATPDAFGASIGRGLQVAAQGASSFGDAMQRIKVQEQETELKTLDVEFSNRVRTLMYGDPIEETSGYLSTQNRDAIGGHVPLRDAIMKAREELISSAESDNVKNRFTIAADRRVNQALTQAAQHANSARRAQAAIISQARAANALNDAANNPDMLKEGLAVMDTEIRASLAGQNEDVIEYQIREKQSDMIVAVIAGARGRGETEQAAMIFRQNSEFMTTEDRVKASVGVFDDLVQGKAQEIYDELVGLGLEGEEAIDFIRENTTGDLRVELISLIDDEEARARARLNHAQGQEDRAGQDAGVALAQEAQNKGLTGQSGEDFIEEQSDGDTREKALQVFRTGESADEARSRAEYVQFTKDRADLVDATTLSIIDAVEDPAVRKVLLEAFIRNDPQNFTPRVIALINGKLETQATHDRAAKAEQLKEASGEASAAVVGGQPLDDFLSQNPGYAASIAQDPQTMARLRGADKARSSGQIFARNSDGETAHSLRILPEEDLASVDLSSYRHKLTPVEFKEVSQKVAAAAAVVRAGGSKTQTEDKASYAGVRRILGDILPKKTDYGSNTASNKDREFNRAATNAANVAVYNFIARANRPPTEVELNDLVYEAVTPLFVDRRLFGRKEIDLSDREDLTSGQIGTASIDYEDISRSRRLSMIEDARNGRLYPGGLVPKDILEQAYGAFILKDIPRYKRLLGVP